MAYAVSPDCIGCGACEFACPIGAISQLPSYPVLYMIDPLMCNDCDRCAAVCPVDALAPDPRWAACHGRGCPLSAPRYSGWACSEAEARCSLCGGPLWCTPAGSWLCPACDRERQEGRGAACPKPRQWRRLVSPATASGRPA